MTTEKSPAELLAELRVDIDRIDASMHELLIERGGIIETLIAVKARQGGGSAFRPDREAEMMRRMLKRHSGVLPLDTVETIWRVIISTFTFVQAPYAVHAATGTRDAAVRDSARFHFGFTVPLITHGRVADAIRGVVEGTGDLGLIPVDAASSDDVWWHGLVGEGAPKIIAHLPFVDRKDHPADLPVFVIAKPGAATPSREVILFAIAGRGEGNGFGVTVVGRSGESRLVAVPAADLEGFHAEAASKGLTTYEVGSHAAHFAL